LSPLTSKLQIPALRVFAKSVLHSSLMETLRDLGNLGQSRRVFRPFNEGIHGITEEKVRDSPTWRAAFEILRPLIESKVVVSHTAFDRVSFLRACEKNRIPVCEARWLDSAKVVRRAWPEYSHSGYGLANVAAHLDIVYRAHDALEDARCAGEILIHAISATGLSVEDWLDG
jgi:DNA polymerase-3 subunit epsilon